MSKSDLKKSFDYSILDKDTKSNLIYFASEILKARDAAAKSVLSMGESLAEAQACLADHSGGVFMEWVKHECGFSKSTAYNLIYAYREFGSFPTVGKLEDGAMYALASPGTPKKARKEAMKLAEQGVSITQAQAKKIIAKHKEKESRSEQGKPGGGVSSSSNMTPVSDGPASSETAAETPEEPEPEPETPVESPDPDKEIRTQKSKTVKTCEALMREFDSLNGLRKRPDDIDWALEKCRGLIQSAKNW